MKKQLINEVDATANTKERVLNLANWHQNYWAMRNFSEVKNDFTLNKTLQDMKDLSKKQMLEFFP